MPDSSRGAGTEGQNGLGKDESKQSFETCHEIVLDQVKSQPAYQRKESTSAVSIAVESAGPDRLSYVLEDVVYYR